jgi:hypothetical protein
MIYFSDDGKKNLHLWTEGTEKRKNRAENLNFNDFIEKRKSKGDLDEAGQASCGIFKKTFIFRNNCAIFGEVNFDYRGNAVL